MRIEPRFAAEATGVMAPRRPRACGGMTLIEVLIAMAILVTVTASTWLIFRGITKAWRGGQLRTERYQQVRLIFDLFGREISSSVANARYPFVGLDAGEGEPINADSTQDALYFTGTLPGRAGLVERGYWVNRSSQLVCHDQEPADGDYTTSDAEEICGRDIATFDVTYYDGTAWQTRWDGRPGSAQAGQVPKAIHIVVVIGEPPRGERFETTIYLPTG